MWKIACKKYQKKGKLIFLALGFTGKRTTLGELLEFVNDFTNVDLYDEKEIEIGCYYAYYLKKSELYANLVVKSANFNTEKHILEVEVIVPSVAESVAA